jgi:hypothetical protein
MRDSDEAVVHTHYGGMGAAGGCAQNGRRTRGIPSRTSGLTRRKHRGQGSSSGHTMLCPSLSHRRSHRFRAGAFSRPGRSDTAANCANSRDGVSQFGLSAQATRRVSRRPTRSPCLFAFIGGSTAFFQGHGLCTRGRAPNDPLLARAGRPPEHRLRCGPGCRDPERTGTAIPPLTSPGRWPSFPVTHPSGEVSMPLHFL